LLDTAVQIVEELPVELVDHTPATAVVLAAQVVLAQGAAQILKMEVAVAQVATPAAVDVVLVRIIAVVGTVLVVVVVVALEVLHEQITILTGIGAGQMVVVLDC
jgi:hypothetical protein